MNVKTLIVGLFAVLLSFSMLNAADYVAGTVYKSDWVTAISNANISLYTFPGGVYVTSGSSDGSGDYSIPVAAGLYSVNVTMPGYIDGTSGPVSSGGGWDGENFALSVSAPGNLSGLIKAQNGSAIQSATITVTGYETKNGTSDGTGAYTVASITAPGMYDVSISASGYLTYIESNVYIAQNATTYRNYTLQVNPNNGSVVGTVLTTGLSPLSGATVTAYYANGSTAGTAATNSTGDYVLNLTPNTYSITASKTNYMASLPQM